MGIYTNPGAGTQELFSGDLLVDQIANYYNWGRLQMNSRFFSLMSNIGVGQSFKNSEFIINDTAEYPQVLNLASGQTLLVGAINAESLFINLDTVFGVTGLNKAFKVGDAFYGYGYVSATGTRSAGDRVNVALRVSDVNSSGHPKFLTISVTAKAGSYEAATFSAAQGDFSMILSKMDELDGDAPDIELLKPAFRYNYMQMFRNSFGQGKVAGSALTKFDNSLAYQSLIEQDKMFRAIDAALIFGQLGRAAAAVSYNESTAGASDGGTGSDVSTMKGLVGWLECEDLSGSDSLSRISSGSEIDFWDMRDFAAGFTVGNEVKYGFCGSTFANKLEKAAWRVGQVPVMGEISFPRITFQFKEYDLGNIKVRIIRNRNMEVVNTKVYDGTNHAADGNYVLLVDPEYFKINFHDNDSFGIMAPSLYDIDVTNGSHKDKKEWKACLSCSLIKPQAHGVYGITG